MGKTLWKGLGRGCPLLAAVALAVLVAAGSRGLAAEREVGDVQISQDRQHLRQQ